MPPPPVDRRDPGIGRTASRGPCLLYVLPCAWEDLLKLGFSRAPLARLQALHPRWYDFFDLDRALLVQLDSVREARALELERKRALREHNAPAPLTVSAAAGGSGEWFRGAYDQLAASVDALGARGHVLHAPARGYLREALLARAPLLFSWAQAALDAQPPAATPPLPRRARDLLDAYPALGIDPAPWLPGAVRDWHGGRR